MTIDRTSPDNNAMNRSRQRLSVGWSREHFAQRFTFYFAPTIGDARVIIDSVIMVVRQYK